MGCKDVAPVLFAAIALISALTLLASDITWSNDHGTVGLYNVQLTVGLNGYSFSYECRNGDGCPISDHTESGGFKDPSCDWRFCSPCGEAAHKIQALLKACLAFIGFAFVLWTIRAYIRHRGGFFGKLAGVVASALTLIALVATWSLWLDKCQDSFGGMTYKIGDIRVVNVKPQLYYGFIISVLGSIAALLTVVAEAIKSSFSVDDQHHHRTVGINYSLVMDDGS